MIRYIRFFKKSNDELIGEIPVDIDINILLNKYNSKTDDPMMIYSYAIKPEDENFYMQFLSGYKFDFINYDYFIEYC